MEKREQLKEDYVEPKVLATYRKEELEEIIRPHGNGGIGTPNGGGCGCGCGG